MNEILQKRIEEEAKKYCQDKNYILPDDTELSLEALTAIDAYIEAANFALKNQWISVEEALPKCDKCHLAMYEDGGIIVAKYENETWWWQDGFVVGRNTDGDLMYSSSCEVPCGLITHWMPIPQLKGGEK